MSKVICKSIEVVKASEVSSISGTTINLKAGVVVTTIPALKITYNQRTDQPNAGALQTETVTIEAYISDVSSLLDATERYVLRPATDDGKFIVGSVEFPALKTFSDDKVRATITFIAQKAL
jgi:hypothetical protein